MFTEDISDEYRGMFTGLLDDDILMDSATAVSTSGACNIIHIADFRPGVYGELVITAWTLKWNVTIVDLLRKGIRWLVVATTALMLQGSFDPCPETTLTRGSDLPADEKNRAERRGLSHIDNVVFLFTSAFPDYQRCLRSFL